MRNLFCVFIYCVSLLIGVPLALVLMLVTWDTSASIWVARRLWSPTLLWAGGAKLEVFGAENVDPSRPTIYISNHQSTIDIPTLFLAVRVDLRFIAKKELQYVPLLGWYMMLAKFVFIDRGNRQRAVASMDRAGERIRSGISIVAFPEGTRSDDGRVLPFKKGPFALAIKAGVAVCPVTIEGSGNLMPKSRWTITPGPIRVKIGAPIATHSLTEGDREKLMKQVRDTIIDQSLELGGKGGDKQDVVAQKGSDGVGRAVPLHPPTNEGRAERRRA
ncbi:MAG: lysophospholipid acyltransferase family protein [Myxococcaceae bacterium]